MKLKDNYSQDILGHANAWLSPPFDEETIRQVKNLMENDSDEFNESFYTDLEFGTGGLRGIMGVGTNRLNKYTVGLATQGFANYLNQQFQGKETAVAIAYDSRNNSPEFARNAADVLTANGIKVFLFDALRPTPLLSFAVRHLKCQGGIVVTASHNPPAYNGYKVYWEDGGQIVRPHDAGIINEVRAIASYNQVKSVGNDDLLNRVGEEVDEAYLKVLATKALSAEVVKAQSNMPIVYTSLHGTGITMVPKALKMIGLNNVHLVASQEAPDGNFPTVASPNPEEGAALQAGIDLAKKVQAEIVLGTDPDTDRVGIAVRNTTGEYVLLNGNDTGALLVWYQLTRMQELNVVPSNGFIGKTVVTSEIITEIASHFGLPCYDTLTGFKWIADLIRSKEGEEVFITGGEESYGYMIGDFVRDKDGVAASMMICEMTAWAKSRGMNLLALLEEVHEATSVYREALVSLKKEGMAGKEEIALMMKNFRENPPTALGGENVSTMIDFQNGTSRDIRSNEVSSIDLPSSNVIQYVLEDGSRVTARPSGTEPKIKFYFSVRNTNKSAPYNERINDLNKQIEMLKSELLAG
ncbi:MAG: phospho-sugar mutase [Flavobacteriales bacterium]|nr:phospho-sugar mutase [Flavobacteriales bacterium]